MFSKRLEKYRTNKKLNKREMAEKLNISESYYNLIENGKREPSKKVLYELVLYSKQPEEYWLYGITSQDEVLEIREEFKCSRTAFEYWNNLKELDQNVIKKLFSNIDELNSMEKIFIKAFKADLEHLLEKCEKKSRS